MRSILAVGLAALVLASVVFLPQAAVAPRGDVGDAVAAKLDVDYMRGIIEHITSIGSSPLGFRTAGTPEDFKTASYIVAEMKRIGLKDAGLETVTVDMWRFLGASLTVTAGGTTWTFQAASQGGVPPTPKKGLTGDILFVGKGRAMDYEVLESKGISAKGKLVLADWDADEVWTNHIAMEAIARGALGTVITVLPGGDYYQAPNAIGSFDSVCDPVLCGSFITISKEDALTILDLLAKGPVTGTMRLDVEMAENVNGYNTIGYIPGSKWPDEYILFNAHHDAWFQSAIDCTSCVASILAIAKAIKESGYQPERTLVFMTSTGEEWGVEDTYYDWLIGSYYRITQTHPAWQGKAVALLNVEGSGFAGDPLEVNVNQEFRSFLMQMLGRNSRLNPYGFQVFETYSWNELWTYAAAGVPGFTFSSASARYGNTIYHTNKDTIDEIDFGYLRQTTEFVARVFLELDRSALLPYDFGRRVGNLEDNIDYTTATQLLGSKDPTIQTVKDAMAEFKDAARDYDAVKGSVSADKVAAVHSHVREALRESLTAFTALSVWDYTVYPHQQLEMDAVHLGMAIDDLTAGRVQGGLRHLEWWVGQSWYIPRLSYVPFTEEMDHHDAAKATGEVHLGGPKAMAWGAQGHLPPYWNLWKAYMGIRDKAAAGNFDFGPELKVLADTRTMAIELYRGRLLDIAAALHGIAAELESAVAAAS
ncbi:MAG: M28 family peptidase [Thermoplasmata archaeon]